MMEQNLHFGERELPVYRIEGIDFIVDVQKSELRQMDNPESVISFHDMTDEGTHYWFRFSANDFLGNQQDGSNEMIVQIPQMTALDPVGMAQEYGVAGIRGLSDYEVMVNPEAVDQRLNYGKLPTIDIGGHVFYVEIRLDKLSPKDDFLSKGIVLSEIEGCLMPEEDRYEFAYDPGRHEVGLVDFDSITEVPAHLLYVQIPSMPILDPIGYARAYNLDMKGCLKRYPPQPHFEAKVVPWEKSGILELIKENKERNRLLKKETVSQGKRKKGKHL